MLRFLRIKRLAVIDAAEMEFGPGLNVLTGETGAGKSILVEAVGLLLGGRASADLIRTGESTATIEAIFDRGGDEIVIRREITSQGRSRAFVNDELATASALKDLSYTLIELHGQHEHQTLLDPVTHLAIVDRFGAQTTDPLLAPVERAHERMRQTTELLDRLKQSDADRGARQELAAFQYAELERAALKRAGAGEATEDVELAAERQVLANAERVERLCLESYSALYESDGAVLASLGGVWRRVSELAAIDPKFQAYVDGRDAIKSQLEDLAAFLRRYADGVDASPAKLQQIDERLALLERIKRKYGPSLGDAVAKRDRLKEELASLEKRDERIEELTRTLAAARTDFTTAAGRLSAARRRVAGDLSKRLERLLGELAMDRARFEVRFEAEPLPEEQWTARGVDRAEFYLSPNPGEELRPLARIVSGGELSRVMLAIKTLTFADRLAAGPSREGGVGAPGLIFDEIDAGIGGRVADVVGRKLWDLGSAFQVICITHLPQIAACGDTHFQIEKQVTGGRPRTSVIQLDAGGRIEELGRMLGGGRVTDAVRASAREMLEGRGPLQRGESESPKGRKRNRGA